MPTKPVDIPLGGMWLEFEAKIDSMCAKYKQKIMAIGQTPRSPRRVIRRPRRMRRCG